MYTRHMNTNTVPMFHVTTAVEWPDGMVSVARAMRGFFTEDEAFDHAAYLAVAMNEGRPTDEPPAVIYWHIEP